MVILLGRIVTIPKHRSYNVFQQEQFLKDLKLFTLI